MAPLHQHTRSRVGALDHNDYSLLDGASQLPAMVERAQLPAISVPCGFSAAGLPIGMQLIGNVLDEPRLLQLAHQYEQAANVMANRPKALLVP